MLTNFHLPRPSLLLLDEPGANLDFRSRQRLLELLAGRSEAFLLATHDLDMVRRICTRVIVLDAGKIADDRAALIAKDIATKIKNELDYPGQIKVTVIREMRAVEYAR